MKAKTKNRIIALVIFAAILILLTTAITAFSTYKAKRQNEHLKNFDFYKMSEFSSKNSEQVMKALASGNSKKLEKQMIDSEGAAAVMEFADWKKADFENAVSMGAGSLTTAPDENGKMDISERFFVDIGDTRYLLFVETSTSRWGRANDGVSAVAVTTLEHFDELDWDWNGEPDDSSVLAGKLLWNAGKGDEES
jgi:hypothetical protein